jgi:hypothetical protein
LNLNWINNIYITSPNLGSFDTVFAGRRDNNIIKKTPIQANYGYMNIDQVVVPNDFLDCSKRCLQTLEFHSKTAEGEYVPPHNAHVSCSIIVNKFAVEEIIIKIPDGIFIFYLKHINGQENSIS